jgi:hypothetical protein
MPKLTKKEGLFLAISGNKYDRLIKAGYVLPEHHSFSPDTIHFTLTATGRGALEIHKKKALWG